MLKRRDKWGHPLCKHNKVLAFCKDCKGREICIHDKQRGICKECGGRRICKHSIDRQGCADCSPTGVYGQYRRKAKQRNRLFLLSFQEYERIAKSACVYCGSQVRRNGIDRKDNSVGYTSENSVPCCSKCNFMKHKYTVEEFLEHAKRIVEYSTKGK